jgi:hypothetical protein
MHITNLLINSQGDYYIKKRLFEIFVIFTLIMVFFEKFSLIFLATFAFSIYVINLYIDYDDKIQNNKNEQLLNKLVNIQNIVNNTDTSFGIDENFKFSENIDTTSNLYIDSSMIEFLDSILWMYDYNPKLFYRFMLGLNNILKFRIEVENFYKIHEKTPPNINEMVNTCIDLKFKTINNLKSFVHVLPSTKEMTWNLNDIVLHYHQLMDKNIYFMRKNQPKDSINL